MRCLLLLLLILFQPSVAAEEAHTLTGPYEFAKWYVENLPDFEDSMAWETIVYRLGSDVDRAKPWDVIDPSSRNAVYTNLYTDTVFHATKECAQDGGIGLHRLSDKIKEDVICISIHDAINRNLDRCYECW